MERYNLRKDARQFVVTKRWITYIWNLSYALPFLLLPLILSTGGRYSHQPLVPLPLPLLLALPFAWIVGCGIYVIWKTARGGDTYLFDAQKHLFERHGHVISHWDGISELVIVDVPHRHHRRNRWLVELLTQEKYYYTYRLVVALCNGKKHVLDECGSKEVIMALAQEIAAYTNKPVSSDLAKIGWFA